MKLLAGRDQDRLHLRDMIDVGSNPAGNCSPGSRRNWLSGWRFLPAGGGEVERMQGYRL